MQTEQQSLRAAAGQRFWQIDALRGLALLNMLVYLLLLLFPLYNLY